MSHSYISNLVHFVFSTKDRQKIITSDFRERLWAFLGGIARENKMKALAVGGTADHIHILLTLPATITIAKAIQLLKGGSSKWVHETFPMHRHFAWQQGYGAFSINVSRTKDTLAYIHRQDQHHRTKSFEAEFLIFLKAHGIEYDERYIWS